MRVCLGLTAIIALSMACLAQNSAKRGLGWDERQLPLQATHMELLAPGVDWVYNWGSTPHHPELYGQGSMVFAPMCWNASFDEAAIRSYLEAHPETRYLLGFNEPNFSSQSAMTPSEAAASWPRLEAIAGDYGLTLVAPALNFTAESVGGRYWNPYEWLDEFFRLAPQAKVDCLALHCYMNWYSACTWFATEYFYSDLYNPAKKDVYGRYPNLVDFLDAFKAEHGHFPRMMLTEFCAWENDGTISGVDFQIDQMTQKLQKLEQSDLVEGYAWFMGNGNAADYPYWSVLQTNSTDAGLSDLGKVYVYMSKFDRNRFYAPGETVQAKDYVEATTDEVQIKVRPNSEPSSNYPLQIEIPAGGWNQYRISPEESGQHTFTLHMRSEADIAVVFYLDSRRTITTTLPSTGGVWDDRSFTAVLNPGEHDIMLYNAGPTSITLNSWTFQSAESGLVDTPIPSEATTEVFDLQGRPVEPSGELTPGLYIRVSPAGTTKNLKLTSIL